MRWLWKPAGGGLAANNQGASTATGESRRGSPTCSNWRGRGASAGGLRTEERSSRDRTMIEVMVRLTDTSCELRYHRRRRKIVALISLKARLELVRSLRSGGTSVSACGITTWERVMKNMTLGAFALASALALTSIPAHALSFDFSFTGPVFPENTPGTVTGEIDGLVDNATVNAS